MDTKNATTRPNKVNDAMRADFGRLGLAVRSLDVALDDARSLNITYRRDDSVTTAADRVAEAAAAIGGGEYRPAYNGWKNRETWNASLWINNDEKVYTAARAIIRAAMDGSDYETRGMVDDATDRRYQLRTAADELARWFEETFGPRDTASPLSDAWAYTCAVVEWFAVVEGLAEDMPAAHSGAL